MSLEEMQSPASQGTPVERSVEFVTAGYFLAACSERDGTPPKELGVPDWNHAYAVFYAALADGRSLTAFKNSLKHTRDTFDGWVESPRAGWRNPADHTKPKSLTRIEQHVFDRWQTESRESLWEHVESFVDGQVRSVPSTVLADIESSEEAEGKKRTEGGRRVVVSSRIERNPALRAEALRIHGYQCMACGFDFETAYGSWGRAYAEVHHLELLSDRSAAHLTDPRTDLAVVCSNCHRMIHRRRDTVLSLDELRAKLRT